MAEALLCDGLDPDYPDAMTLVVVVSEVADHHERAAARLASYGYEGRTASTWCRRTAGPNGGWTVSC